MKTNLNQLISLLQTNYTTVGVRFYQSRQTYTYKALLSLELREGDLVVVHTSIKGYSVADVVQVYKTPKIDVIIEHYKWVVQRVDLSLYSEILAKEEQAIETLREIEEIKQRKEVVDSFTNNLPPSLKKKFKKMERELDLDKSDR